ncbi:MAG: hypothetical protein HY033_08065 [Ignavibacteriae bacterium]|nr:hypothetical protein [Ignavibacteria bacterium]MBI3364847.1 hypothetical protein [Ignavibacteriota bacterium]
MTYIIRNTIVLGAVLIVILGFGWYATMYSLPKQLKKIDAEIKRIEVDLQNTPDLANQYNQTTAQLEDMKRRWETRNKDVPPKDITGETYGYLNRTIDVSGEIKMDMTYVGPKDFGQYGYNVYTIKGEAPFGNLFKFIWLAENGRRLIKISNLSLRGYEARDKDTKEMRILVLFDMELQSYFSSIPELNTAPMERSVVPVSLTSNPFYPLILHEIPGPQANEIEIERSDLKAVIPGKAFITDQNQKSRTLEEGDKVYLGYVTKIYPEEGKIECLLNRGGVSERYELRMRAGQPIK